MAAQMKDLKKSCSKMVFKYLPVPGVNFKKFPGTIVDTLQNLSKQLKSF